MAVARPAYLPHLDGVRGAALLCVLCFHFRVPLCAGGYVGVDVFLVLSGFLMTRNILHALACDRWAFASFYASRFWRLYPSALCTVLCTLLGAAVAFPPDLAFRVAQSAAATLAFSSNFYFLSQDNYFDVAGGLKPLLHHWSLSLEEQYYAVWPLLLFLSFRRARVLAALVALVALSVAASAAAHSARPMLAFFMLPARAWEFGVGGLATLAARRPVPPRWRAASDLAAVAALATVLLSAILLRPGAPVLAAAPAVLATAALCAMPETLVSQRVLASGTMRWIGKVSYAAYLVHWPLYVYMAYLSSSAATPALRSPFLLFPATFVLASAQLAAVENPMRSPKCAWRRGALAAMLLASAVLIWSALSSGGWVDRSGELDMQTGRANMRDTCVDLKYDPPVDRRYMRDAPFFSSGCVIGRDRDDLGNYSLVKLPKVDAMVIGNSYARHVLGAVHAAAGKDRRVLVAFKGGCTFGVMDRILESRSKQPAECMWYHEHQWAVLQKLEKNTTVIVAVDWKVGRTPAHTAEAAIDVSLELSRLGLRPIISSSVPAMSPSDSDATFPCYDVRRYCWSPLCSFLSRMKPCPVSHVPRHEFIKAHMTLKQYAESHKSFEYIDFYKTFCKYDGSVKGRSEFQYRCPSLLKDPTSGKYELLFERDGVHLSWPGSLALYQPYKDVLDGLPRLS